MFSIFRKKKAQNTMSQMASAMYGKGAQKGKSDLAAATKYAFENLLGAVVPFEEVAAVAQELRNGEMPYSTEDLALATALNFFRRDELQGSLSVMQMPARMQMIKWLQDGKVNLMLVQVFEDTLYNRFKPGT